MNLHTVLLNNNQVHLYIVSNTLNLLNGQHLHVQYMHLHCILWTHSAVQYNKVKKVNFNTCTFKLSSIECSNIAVNTGDRAGGGGGGNYFNTQKNITGRWKWGISPGKKNTEAVVLLTEQGGVPHF